MRSIKIISIIALIGILFGCNAPEKVPFMLDGPGMVYIDREHRTEYANVLPFDEHEDQSYWAVAYLGEGETGRKAAKEYIEELFAELSEEKRNAIEHYDYGGEKWYLVIPRYGDENKLIKNGDKGNLRCTAYGIPYTINCNADVEINLYIYNGHKTVLDTDENGKLIHTEDVWDITEYNE